MPNCIHHAAILDSQEKPTTDLELDSNTVTQCVDNIHFNESNQTDELDRGIRHDHEESETLERPGSSCFPKSYESSMSWLDARSNSTCKSLHKLDLDLDLNQFPLPAQTCLDSFYTPTNRSLPPIIGMRDLQIRQIYDESAAPNNFNTKINDNDFHFPKSDGIEFPNGYVPWYSELNDSDCDDGMFERVQQQVEDMHVDTDSNDCQPTYSEIVPSYAADEQTHNLFMDAFIQNNRLDSVSQVMGYHPDYLRIFLSTQHFLLREDGPLSRDYRHYIAILAAARHHCTYLVELHEQDFLRHSGNPEWLKGLENAPRKLRDLYEINKLLAHQPWLITKEHMLKLLKSPEPWSLSELMHAIILLTQFHALCSFVFGCGISSELDSQGGHAYLESVLTSTAPTSLSSCTSSPTSAGAGTTTTTTTTTTTVHPTSSPSDSTASLSGQSPPSNGCADSGIGNGGADVNGCNVITNGGATSNGCADVNSNGNCQINEDESDVCVKVLMEKMRQVQEASSAFLSVEERIKQFNMEGKSTAEIAVPNSKTPASKSEMMKYIQDNDFGYTDFATRTCTEVSTFCACDYSWEDHGFSLANRLYADIGNYLDDKYSTAANMTYYTMGDLREVDTSSFRRAIWNYIHIMYGICHDDYDYSETNQLLEINLKAYIKTLTCYPERLKKKDFDGVMKGFQHSEKVHVNLMLMEARQQAELLYALRALNSYLT